MNDYMALQTYLQAPQVKRQEDQSQGIANFMKIITQVMAQGKIKNQIANADKTGEKVEYKVDPNTGIISPVFSKNNYESVFEALKNPDIAEKYELGRGAKGEPRLIKKKSIKPNVINGIKATLSGDKDEIIMKNPATGDDERINITNEKDVEKAMSYLGIEDWRNNPEMIEAGIPAAYDQRAKARQEKLTQIEAAKEPQIQPFATGLGRIGNMGADYKAATVKYGEAKTKQIVDTMVTLQKQGKTLAQIRKMLEEAGADADAFLKPYGK